MKNKKIVLIIVLLYAINTHSAFALKRAVFPDSQSLQPLPPDVHANISGNINSTTTVLPEEQNEPNLQKSNINETPTNQESPKKNNMSLIIWPVVLLTVIILYLIYKALKRKSKSI